jgi:hypothetical protein
MRRFDRMQVQTGVPVLVSVAAIFLATMPDLPGR